MKPIPSMWQMAPVAVGRHADLQRDVLRTILSSPAHAYPVARRLGVTRAVFWMDDYAAIFRAVEREHVRGIETVLLAAADLLGSGGMWSSHAPRDAFGPQWSLASLAAFACSWATGWTPLTAYCLKVDVAELSRVQMLLNRSERLRREAMKTMDLACYPPARRRVARVA